MEAVTTATLPVRRLPFFVDTEVILRAAVVHNDRVNSGCIVRRLGLLRSAASTRLRIIIDLLMVGSCTREWKTCYLGPIYDLHFLSNKLIAIVRKTDTERIAFCEHSNDKD